MLFAGGLEKFYAVDPGTARRVRTALANGERGFLAFEASDLVAVVHCSRLVWTHVMFDADLPQHSFDNVVGEAALDFRLKLHFDDQTEPHAFEFPPDAAPISQEAGDRDAEVQWLLAMLEGSGEHQDVMSFASMDGEVIFNLARLNLVEAPAILVRPDQLAAAIDALATRPHDGGGQGL